MNADLLLVLGLLIVCVGPKPVVWDPPSCFSCYLQRIYKLESPIRPQSDPFGGSGTAPGNWPMIRISVAKARFATSIRLGLTLRSGKGSGAVAEASAPYQ
jgi:hypothetical protein